MMQRLGLDVQVIECEWGSGADEAALQKVQAIRKEEFTIRQRIDRIRYQVDTGQVITSSILY